MSLSRIQLTAAVAALLGSAPALAHPKVVSASPAANATVAAPKSVEVRFSEKLVPKFSGADLVMTGMPGMKDHPATNVPGKAAVAADGLTLVVTPGKPLAAGSYRLDWHVVSVDTHRVAGSYSFAVR